MSFAEICGQEPAIRLLKGQMKQERLANTYLFIGPPGIGKWTLGMTLAKALQCEKPKLGDACGECRGCQQVVSGSHPDVMIVSSGAESDQIRIEQIRALMNWMALTAYGNCPKVGLVRDADQLTQEAAHACLKMLEEPPEKSLIVLTARGLHRLPQTLVSRCHVVRCVPQGIQQTASFLREREGLDAQAALRLATLSGGRLGRALDFHRNQRLEAKNRLVDQLLAGWRRKSVEIPLGTEPAAEVEEAIEWLAAWWRDQMILQLDGDRSWLIHQDRLEDLRKEKGIVPLEILLGRVEKSYKVQEAVQMNASPRIGLGALLSQD